MNPEFIDTHTHLDGEEFAADLDQVVARAREAGAAELWLPAIHLPSVATVKAVAQRYPGFAYPMIGLHPEEVKDDWKQVIAEMKQLMSPEMIAIGEVGLDYYWSREYADEQLKAFRQQVEWSIACRLPLVIHCRKAQNEMVKLLMEYRKELVGGIFHCFTGNAHEAAELLQFERFVLGIGGVLTFKKSHLPEVLPSAVPLHRIVLETDAPYMAPVPHRGERNEPSFVTHILRRLAESYGVSEEEVARVTTATARALRQKRFSYS